LRPLSQKASHDILLNKFLDVAIISLDKVSLGSDQLYRLGRLGGAAGPPSLPTSKCKVRKNLVYMQDTLFFGGIMPQRILIVDDERKLVHGLVGYFRQAGFDTLTAYDGRAALEIARRDQPDLIVLDLMLPELDGMEVCKQIRRSSAVTA